MAQYTEKDLEHRVEANTTDADASSQELQTVDKPGVDDATAIIDLSEKEEKRILRKIDFRLLPLLTFLYLIAFVDRSNIGNANIAGLTKDLKLHGHQYNAAVSLFYVPYCLLEVPSNIVLKLMRPSRWITILLFCWGMVMTLMGLVSSYKGLLAARFFLGVAEAGFFPAATFLLTIWYKRYEYQRRLAIFYSMASLAGAFSGLLAFAIEKMDGIGGRSGWQWIFILEGLVPIACSIFMWKILPDTPETATFLTKHEKEFVINRIAADTGSGKGHVTNTDKIQRHHVLAAFKDWKIWAMVIVFWGNAIGVYGFSATIPAVVKGLGYSAANAQLLTIPLYVCAIIFVLLFSWLSDKYKVRWIFIILGFSVAAIGYIAQLAIPHPKYPGLSYGLLFPLAGGIFCTFPPILSWAANNVAPSSKRAVSMAILISVGNTGAIVGSNVYIAREAPKYHTGFGVCFAFVGAGFIMTLVLRWAYARENKKREDMMASLGGEEGVRAKYSEQELLDMGDLSPFFRYTL